MLPLAARGADACTHQSPLTATPETATLGSALRTNWHAVATPRAAAQTMKSVLPDTMVLPCRHTPGRSA